MDRRNVEDIYPLSPMQQGMLFHSLFAPEVGSYVVQTSCTLDKSLDVAALMRAWRQLIERHTILRTAFVWEGLEQPLQVVQRRASIPLDERDWRGLPQAEQSRRLEDYLREDQLRDFDFARAPLMRLALLRLGEDVYRFVWSFHHVLLDGWSVPLVLKELFTLYEANRRGQRTSLEPRRPYGDYIAWLQKQSLARAEAFWRRQLKGFPAPTPLGVDRAGKAASCAGQMPYAVREMTLPRQPLQDAARRHQLTLNTFIQGAWALLLGRYSGEPEVVFGAIGSGRPAEVPGIESMIGLFINTLPVRVGVPVGARLLPWLRRLQEQQSELRQYEYTPLVQIQKWSEVPQDGPLFESVVVFENYPVSDSLQASSQESGDGGGVKDVRHVAGTNYPLTLVVEIGSELVFKVLYEKARFEDETVARLLGHLRTLLEAMTADPERRLSQLPLLTEAERRQVVSEWNDTTAEIPAGCFHQLFEAQAERRPDAVALLHDGGQLSYAELNRRANRLAHHLRARGVGPETLVAVCVERSPEMVFAALAVLKAGGAYLPLDPSYPKQRLSFVMDDARAKLLLTQEHLLERLPRHSAPFLTLDDGAQWLESESEANPANVSSPAHLAYVIYTSGSTGRPKGVLVGQKGLSNLISAQAEAFGVDETSRVLQFASFSFDASISEIAVALASGATLCVPCGDTLLSGERLREILRDWSITVATLPPTVLLNTDAEGLPSLRTVIAAGERCPGEVVAKWGAGRCFINAYGPTENTVCATMHECGPAEGDGVPSESLMENARTFDLDSALRPVGVGVKGEAVVGEAGVARGYPGHRCIQQLFAEQAARTPDAVAVVFGDRQLTYRELDQRADLLARHLRGLGVGPEDTVGVCAERGPEMVVGLVAILKAGGAYLPLDPQYPHERLSFMFEDARPKALLTTRRLLGVLPAHRLPSVCLDEELPAASGVVRESLDIHADPEGLAYVVYTSGSTGRPKGVMVSHRNVVRLVRGTDYVALGAQDRVAQLSNESFDAFTFEVWGALLNGAQLVMLERDVALSPALLGSALAEHGVTAMFLTTALFNQIAQTRPDAFRGVRYVLVGGDAVDAGALRAVLAAGAPGNLINAYGPTENTTFSTWKLVSKVEPDATSVPIGRPIANSEAYVLGEGMEPVPVGVRGELYLGGRGVARGYLRRAALTAERFVPHPFSSEPGARLYRTGDTVRYLPSGEIEFLGRLDHQVKIRGFRVELGEVEAALASHPAVRESVVLLTEASAQEKRLVAYLVAGELPAPSVTALRAYLEERLPHYMVPSLFVTLPEMPLTPNGKIDRKALPEPSQERPALEEGFAGARTPVEEMLSNIWAQVLRLEGVGVHDNFFDLGGHSLTSIQIASRATEAFQVDVPVRAAFESPTVAQLARRIEAQLRTQKSPVVEPIRPVGRGDALPLSFAQQRLWFLDQLEGGSHAAYNVPTALRLSGHLDLQALEQTIGEILRRHESLRTTFDLVDGQPRQRISTANTIRLAVTDLTHLPHSERDREADRLVAEEARRPFDLSQGPLLRASVLRLREEEHIILFTMHHIVCDGWSMGVLVKEVSALYEAFRRAEPSPLAELSVQYADYAAWQRQWLQGEVLEQQLDYWTEQLTGGDSEGELPVLELPTDRPRPAVQTFRGAVESFELPAELSRELKRLSRAEGVTLYMTLLAAFEVLLHRYTGQEQVLVGTPSAGRGRQELEGLIGFFVNTLVMRGDISGEPSFKEVLGRVREAALGAYAHQELPFELLVEKLQPERDLSHNPIFQVMFTLENLPGGPAELEGSSVSQVDFHGGVSIFDLTLHVRDTGPTLAGSFEYNTDLFDAVTVSRLAEHFTNLLQAVVANPLQSVRRVRLLSEAERRRLLVEWNGARMQSSAPVFVQRSFERQAERTPDAVALVSEDEQLSYAELNRRANRLAHHLRARGVGAEAFVGICVERSAGMIVAMLGVLKAGAAYVPLDPAYPRERLAFILKDAGVKLILTEQRHAEALPVKGEEVVCLDAGWDALARESESNPAVELGLGNAAYVIYTSGSTGQPKGVVVQHDSLANFVEAASGFYEMDAADRVLQFASINFDASVEEIYPCLTRGGTLVLRPAEMLGSVASFLDRCRELRLTVLDLPTAYWHQLVSGMSSERLALPEDVRLVIIGGERAAPEQVATWGEMISAGVRLVNSYGPTEATVVTTVCDLRGHVQSKGDGREVPIGRALPNVEVYVLDEALEVVPTGVVGQLYVGGGGLARGYLNRPALSAEKFVPHPFGREGGARLYATGDLARYTASGQLEFCGRVDGQVKIRGFRIEPAEVEKALAQHPSVAENVVLALAGARDELRLVAYVVAREGLTPSAEDLREFLSERLPAYTIPSAFVTLGAMPLTPSGKLDRKALPAPELSDAAASASFVAPRNEVELRLSHIWEEVLGLRRVGIHDNFFRLGGHSLLAVRLMSEIRKHFGQSLPLATLFQGATVEQLAAHLRAQADERPWSHAVAIQPHGDRLPFFCVHPIGGQVLCYYDLAQEMGTDQPFYGLQAPDLAEAADLEVSIEGMAAQYLAAVRAVQPSGPYFLGGYSFGGGVAFEMARQLREDGEEVALLAMLDTWSPAIDRALNVLPEDAFLLFGLFAEHARQNGFDPQVSYEELRRLGPEEQLRLVLEKGQAARLLPHEMEVEWLRRLLRGYKARFQAALDYVPRPYDGRITVFRVSERTPELVQYLCERGVDVDDPTLGWQEFSDEPVETYRIPGHHETLYQRPQVGVLAEGLRACIEQTLCVA